MLRVAQFMARVRNPNCGLTLGGEALKLLSESRSPTATPFQAIAAEVFT